MFSMLANIDSAITSFFTQLTAVIGFSGYLGIALGVEVIFILLFLLKSNFSYEARLKRSLEKYNNWLFQNKKLDENNIKQFNNLARKGPKRFVYFWQQFVLFREKGPTSYLSEENLIEKPLRTSSWESNIKNFNLITIVWAAISLLFGFASQAGKAFSLNLFAIACILPVSVLVIGLITTITLKAKRVLNLDDIYHNYHIFARFITNACVDLPVYIDYELLFTKKEIAHGNPQLREFYETRARKAKEEFENAKKNEVEYVEYNFEKAGVDGSLVLDRAMRESEAYLNKKQLILTKISDIEMQQQALKRNYENTQKELQKKIQAAKESIAKLLHQQETTTSRMEVSFLRKQQDQERAKQEQFQAEYDQEEARYTVSSDELKKELEQLRISLEDSKIEVEKAMLAEYQSFYEKVLKVSTDRAERRVRNTLLEYKEKVEEGDKQLTIVQTQIKRLTDENETLRAQLAENGKEDESQGEYDENGNYVYEDGSYIDREGFFHDVEGNVYDSNGNLVKEKQKERNESFDKFGVPYLETEESLEENSNNADNTDVASQFGETAESDIENVEDDSDMIGEYDENGNYVYKDGSYYDPEGYFHNTDGNIYDVDGNLIEEKQEQLQNVDNLKEEENASKDENQESNNIENKDIEDKTQIEKVEDNEEPVKRKRGRPRKEVVEINEEPKQPKKRGRPRKEEKLTENNDVIEENKTSSKKRKPYKKSTTSKSKSAGKSKVEKVKTQKSSGKIKNSIKKEPTLEQLSKMISQQEEKLNKMKEFINTEIDDALNLEGGELNKEKDEIMKSVENLKEKAETVKQSNESDSELANINKRLEELIKQISNLNNKNS